MRRVSRSITVAAAGLLALTGIVAGAPGPAVAAHTCGSGVASDFNGDGVADAAIGQPDPVDTSDGFLHIVYGTRFGLSANALGTALDDQLIVLASPPHHGSFGATLATGDFDGDGCADLAVGQPAATVGGMRVAGSVQVFLGSETGVSFATTLTAAQVPGGAAREAGQFSLALATGDVNGDHLDDLIVGQPTDDAGTVFVFPGALGVGLSGGTGRMFRQGDGVVPGSAEPGDQFGMTLTTGDFNHDGRADVAVGSPGENGGKGAVMVVRGAASAALLTATGRQIWTQDTAGVGGTAEPGDEFGLSLAAGDFDGDSRDDLAIGVPGESDGGVLEAGAVNVLYSAGSTGLDVTGTQIWHPANPEYNALFGDSLAAGDFDGDSRDDLAIGGRATVDGQQWAGSVSILPGAPGGLTATGGSTWNQGKPGIGGSPELNDLFGNQLTVLRTTSASHDDLLVGVWGEELGTACQFNGTSTYAHDGAVEFIPGSGSGLTATGSQLWDANTAGLKYPSAQPCGFGTAVA